MFHVYIDYTLETTPRPFYVGKGTEERVQFMHRNTVHSRIVAKYGVTRAKAHMSAARTAWWARRNAQIQTESS